MESYETILKRMKDTFRELSGYDADDASDIGIRMRVLAGEVFNNMSNIEWLKNQMFAKTATGTQLEYHAEERGLARKSGSNAEGDVTFYCDAPAAQNITIPAGSVVSTSGIDPIRFSTTHEGVLIKGAQTVTLPTICSTIGTEGNVLRDTINVLVTPVLGISHIKNTSEFYGGQNPETDASLRERIIESYRNIPNGSNLTYYINEAMKIEGVYSANAVPRARGAGTLNIYIMESGGIASDSLVQKVQSIMSEKREINVDVIVTRALAWRVDVYATVKPKTGFSVTAVKENCEHRLKEAINTRGVGKKLSIIEIGDIIYHTEGVASYSFISGNMNNSYGDDSHFLYFGEAVILEE